MPTKVLDSETLAALDATCRGEVFAPGRAGYDAARRLFNGMIDRYPAAIVRCADAEDVSAAVRFARANDIEMSVRSGGHGVSGQAIGDGVLTIDLSAMKRIAVDPASQTIRCDAGVTWGELDPATQAHGLAVTGGRVASTGVAGLTLGSGSGWLERTLGFTCDNLLSAEVVLADGRIVQATDDENPDLLWGLKGGGGNFGIVTAFEFRLHKIGPEILGGPVVHRFEDATKILRLYRDFMATAPDEVGGSFAFVTMPDLPMIPEAVRGKLVAVTTGVYFGPIEEGERVLAPLRSFGQPVIDRIGPITYCGLQTMNDGGTPWGLNNYYKADFLRVLDDAAIEAFVDQARGITSPNTALLLQPLGGVLARVPIESTPLGRRDAAYAYHCLTCWTGDDHDRHVAWTRQLAAALAPFAVAGVYLTYSGEDGEQRVREAYGPEKYARLVALKNKFDPDNTFHRNPNIRPVPAALEPAMAS